MIKVAVYGKGGIGKSTTVSNVAVALAEKGMKVMQIGCDPKADSTILLRHGKKVPTVLELYNEKRQELKLTDMVQIGYGGVVCVEAGGPHRGLDVREEVSLLLSRSLRKTEPMRPINRTLFFMTYWEMLSAVDFPCPCERGMQIRYLSSPPEKTWPSMQGQILPWQWIISETEDMHLLAA